jgi:hypothetical protein
MAITGRVNLITDQNKFFAPIVLGEGKPTSGFAPFTKHSFDVMLMGWLPSPLPVPLPIFENVDTVNGSFALPEFPGSLNIDDVSISLSHGGRPFYRSQKFKYARAKEGGLDIYLYQPSLPPSDGISAGTISQALSGSKLPGNTKLTAKPWGLGVAGSEGQADVQFGVGVVPDSSSDLGLFVDLQLNGWNIHVGWPQDWFCPDADDILASIKTALQKDDSKINGFIKTQIDQILEKPPVSLSSTVANILLDHVSVTFTTIVFPSAHVWGLSNTTDKTIVMSVHPTLGYPRRW